MESSKYSLPIIDVLVPDIIPGIDGMKRGTEVSGLIWSLIDKGITLKAPAPFCDMTALETSNLYGFL